ncbi:MAG: hypothetical protein HC771_17490 [Synechococcales cyanobacterium CRU_2_2]|nr:hypothetical protein [Synechococcales cyanobacterium CRU_2_2]
MPASTRGQRRDQRTFVKINALLALGWAAADLSQAAGISNADLKNGLGHLSEAEAMATPSLILVTGANAPKPVRVIKRLRSAPINSRGTLSTYCGFDKLAAAAALGFRISIPARPGPPLRPFSPGARTATGVVTLSNSLNCAVAIDPLTISDSLLTQLGIAKSSALSELDRGRLVRGARSKPGRVQIALENGVIAQLPFSTAKEADAAELGKIVSRERVEYPNAMPL